MSDIRDAAIGYASRGWAVFPLRERSKAPAVKGGFKSATDDEDMIGQWYDTYPDHNLGIATGAVSGGLLVIDVDVDPDKGEDGMDFIREWESVHGELPETVTAITGRGGYHFYYRVAGAVPCSVNKELGVDVRCDGGYVVAPPSVHENGCQYQWENHPDDYELADADENVMALVEYLQGPQSEPTGQRFSLPKSIGKGSRDDTLFRYACSLQAQGYDDDYISMVVVKANRERCDPPMSDGDVHRIIVSATGRYEKGDRAKRGGSGGRGDGNGDGGGKSRAGGKPSGKRKSYHKLDSKGNPTGPVKHNELAHDLIDGDFNACIIDGAPAIWNGEHYATGWAEVNRAIINLVDDCKINDQREVRHYVLHMAPEVGASPPWLIGFTNGVLDIRDGAFGPMTEDMVITNIIPHDYDPDAYCKDLDDFLNKVSEGDLDVRANLEEVVGMCMYRSNEFGQCPVLIGIGSNGKSTFILVLRNVLGNRNVSSLDLAVMGRQFQAGRLVGKLANLGDDISNERLSGDVLSVFKKVCTGDWIYTDVKNAEGFEFKPYCTLVFSCNEFPSLGDSSEGMMRRLFPIPFRAHFDKSDPDYDPRIVDKLTTEEAAQYMIHLGVQGLRRVIDTNGLTANAQSAALVDEVRADNDSILQWIDDELLGYSDFDDQVIARMYDRYADWCTSGNQKPFGKKKFSVKVCERYGFASTVTTRKFTGGSKSVRVFRPKPADGGDDGGSDCAADGDRGGDSPDPSEGEAKPTESES